MIEGAGTVTGTVPLTANSGAIQPGAAGIASTVPGTLDMTGNVVLPAGRGNLTLPNGSTTPVGFGVQLAGTGNSLLERHRHGEPQQRHVEPLGAE